MVDEIELHNEIAPAAVRAICGPYIAADLPATAMLLCLESVVVGVFGVAVKMGGDEIVLDHLVEAVRQRLAAERLGPLETKGSA